MTASQAALSAATDAAAFSTQIAFFPYSATLAAIVIVIKF
jgi:hypothetical protein